MPLVQAVIQAELAAEIANTMKKAFASDVSQGSAYPPVAEGAQTKLAAAIAEAVAKVMFKQLTTQAQVLPGIPTAGSPAAHTSVGPGKIG